MNHQQFHQAIRCTGIITFLFLAAVAAGCREDAPEYREGGVSISVDSPGYGIYQLLKASGNRVAIVGEVAMNNGLGTGKRLSVNGAEVVFFEFETKEAANAVAGSISPDGGRVGDRALGGNSHFYRTDRVIVLYTGDDTAITGQLGLVLGTQFAGK